MPDRRQQLGGSPDVATPLIDLGGGLFAPGVALVNATGTQAGTLTAPTSTIARQIRNAGVLHRTGLTAPDKLVVPGTPTLADVTTGGSLVFNTAYKVAVAAASVFGPTTPSSVATLTTANDATSTHAVRITIAQVTDAGFYDIFLSTDAAPLYVARVTEAQRAAGVTVTAVGTISATSPGAGKVDVRVVGTGVATTAAPFTFNNAYNIAPGGVPITPVNCTGYSTAIVHSLVTPADFRSNSVFAFVLFGQIQLAPTVYAQLSTIVPTLLTADAQPLYRSTAVAMQGCPNLIVLASLLSGQGTSVEVYVDLA